MSSAVLSLAMAQHGVSVAVAVALSTVFVLESTARLGWPAPLPSAWWMVAIVTSTRIGGVAGGMWAASLALGHATYTDGFTVGHASGLAVFGQMAARVFAFGFAALAVVWLAHDARCPAGMRQSSAIRGSVAPRAPWLLQPEQRSAPQPGSECLSGESADESARALALLRGVAGRSAHDLNNQLMVLLGYFELRRLAHHQDNLAAEGFSEVTTAVHRCAELTERLLRTSRG